MRKRQLVCIALAVSQAFLFSGCSTFTSPGSPDQSFNVDEDIRQLEAHFGRGPTIQNFYLSPSIAKRNEFVAGRLVLIDIHYIEFIKQFAISKAQLDSAVEIATIGVDLAITLVGGAATKSILGAISGGLTSSKVVVDKNFFEQKTVPVLVTAMNAARKEALVPILQGMTKDLGQYTFATAVSDLHQYYNAGTFLGALQDIQKDAGVKDTNATAKILFERDKQFLEAERQKRVETMLDDIDKLSDAAATALATTPPVSDPSVQNVVDLRDPNEQRRVNPTTAKSILKMIVVMSKRSDKILDAMEAAIKAGK